jgi:hypothetical protein
VTVRELAVCACRGFAVLAAMRADRMRVGC